MAHSLRNWQKIATASGQEGLDGLNAVWQDTHMQLNEYLATRKVKPAQFAQAIGVEASTVSRWLNGHRRPSLALIDRINRETGGQVTVSDFLPEVVSSPPPSEDCPGA